jgi:DNA-directed RNA polymerase beta' subunit
MKIKFLDVNKFVRGLKPVTTTEFRTKAGEFHPDGLFSEKIFGVENSKERSKTYSYIDLNATVIHPTAFMLFKRLDRKLLDFFSTQNNFTIQDDGQYFITEKGVTGIKEFIKAFPKMKMKGGTPQREELIKVLVEAYKAGTLFIDKIPVIPPDLRPAYLDENNNWVIDEINNVYIGLLRKAIQIKGVSKSGALFDLLNYNLQLAVNSHDKFVRTKVSKKYGLIRDQMLGKRVDFSARAVITPGPKLKIDEVGLPLRIAINLFQPFILHHMLYSKRYPRLAELESEIRNYTESELSVDTMKRVMKGIKDGDKIPEPLYELFFETAEIVMKGRVVILKRDPALHDGSYRAFYPVLTRGHTIELSTMQVGPFNADFDGDQMAVYHPLSEQAQKEARERMMKGVGSKSSNDVMYEISKEMAVGVYFMTKDVKLKSSPIAVSLADLEKANNPFIPVRFRGHNTTMGRAILNAAFPPDFPWIEKQVSKKDINKLIPEIIDKYGDDVSRKVFTSIKDSAFKFATISGASLTLDMLEVPDSILRLKEKLPDSSPEEAQKLLKQMEYILRQHLKDTGLYDLIESGAGKGWSQPMQILVAKGIIADTKGNLLQPIKGSFSEGLTNTEYFNAAGGARKGMADRALNTSTTGYFTRQLVYVLSPVEAHPTLRDCKTKRTVQLRLTNDMIGRMTGRYIVKNGKIELFKKSDYKAGDVINLRTPIYCESYKLCHTCYGDLLKRHRSPYVGVLAGASIGERGTQLIMRTFHTGGAASIVVRDVLQDIIDNDPMIEIGKQKLSQYIDQNEDKLVAKKECQIKIDLSTYDINDSYKEEDSYVWFNHLVSQIEFGDLIFNLSLDYPVHLLKQNFKKIGRESLIFTYRVGDTFIEIPMQTEEIKEKVNYVNRLVGGRVVYKDPSHLLNKILKVYGAGVSTLDLVYFEVLASQVLRDRRNQALPARMGKTWDPVMMNIKNTVFSTSFVQGLAFENINKAIETGLVSKQDVPATILEKLVTGESLRK